MSVLPIKTLLEAGAHFGHETKRWNPKMAPYIYAKRNGIHIIDLQKTSVLADAAYEKIRETVFRGYDVLFVGTKKQARESIIEYATKSDSPYVANRWLGGTLTNHEVIKKSIQKLLDLEELEKNNFPGFSKAEISRKRKVLEKLRKNVGGLIKIQHKLPGLLFVVDTVYEQNAILEAKRMNIPIVAIVDTNSDPELIDYPIPGNDDAIRAVSVFCEMVEKAIAEGRNLRKDQNMSASEDTTNKNSTTSEKSSSDIPNEVVSDDSSDDDEMF
ncbi:MAG: 30S ribosomal protein S2 [Spirochaetota bacterium]